MDAHRSGEIGGLFLRIGEFAKASQFRGCFEFRRATRTHFQDRHHLGRPLQPDVVQSKHGGLTSLLRIARGCRHISLNLEVAPVFAFERTNFLVNLLDLGEQRRADGAVIV